MTDTTTPADTPAAPPVQTVRMQASSKDLAVLNWIQNMIPTIQSHAGRNDQLWIRIEWTPEEVLFNATYPEDITEGTEPAPAPETPPAQG